MKKTLVVCIVLAGLLAGIAMSVGAQQSHDAWIPGFASFFVPGLGQFLNGETDKAIVHFGVFIAIDIGGLYLLPWHYYGYRYRYIIGLAHLAWAIYSGYDAYNVAKDTGFSLGMTGDGLTLSYSF
ncbi:MAG: hypothetical protein U9N00_00125 [Candidatus Bipolaricaulota bacterium]|nr:hypothetical protein [Candidatus Bipolaricaulota bacterium]